MQEHRFKRAVKGEHIMERNIGNTDRAIRAVLGLVLVAGALTGYLGPWAWVGVVLLLTSLVRYCPLYSLLRVFRQPGD